MNNLERLLKIISVIHTRNKQDPKVTIPALLDCIQQRKNIAYLFYKIIFATLHHYKPALRNFSWIDLDRELYSHLGNETRVSVILKGDFASLTINLNCEDVIVKEVINGKKRSVPKASDDSFISLGITTQKFLDEHLEPDYLDLLCCLFETIQGEYGWAQHVSVQNGNHYDRMNSDPFIPWFITWVNLFGPELIGKLGPEKLNTMPQGETRRLSNGGVLVKLPLSPLEQCNPNSHVIIRDIKNHLGIFSPSETTTPQNLSKFYRKYQEHQKNVIRSIEEIFRKEREGSASEMSRQAQGCIAGVRTIIGEQLDFNIESLRIFDRLIPVYFSDETDDEMDLVNVQAFGAYLGEFIRRQMGGYWKDEEMQGQPILLDVGRLKIRVDPFDLVRINIHKVRSGSTLSIYEWFKSLKDEQDVN
jgi:hypothetical protein